MHLLRNVHNKSDTPVSKASSEASTFGSVRCEPYSATESQQYQSIPKQQNLHLINTVAKLQISRREGLEVISRVILGRLHHCFDRIRKRTVARRSDNQFLRPIVEAQCELSSSSARERSRSIITRHQRAEELLESLPLKYKKKMRQMIEDYETERIDLMKQLRNRPNESSRSLVNELEQEQLLGRMAQLERDNDDLRSGLNQISQVFLLKPNELENTVSLIFTIVQQAQKLKKAIQQAEGGVKGQDTPKSDMASSKATSKAGTSLQMKPIRTVCERSERSKSPRKKSEQLDIQGLPSFRRLMVRKQMETSASELALCNDSEDEEFGKEKVIEKKTIRKLLRNFIETEVNSKGRSECLKRLATVVGLDLKNLLIQV